MIKNLQEWSAQIRARDGKCMDCGAIEDLHAHHIKHKSSHPELILELANGKTLCYRCHKKEHERNRPPRLSRANKPQRRILLREIEQLKAKIELLTDALSKANEKYSEKQYELLRVENALGMQKRINAILIDSHP